MKLVCRVLFKLRETPHSTENILKIMASEKISKNLDWADSGWLKLRFLKLVLVFLQLELA